MAWSNSGNTFNITNSTANPYESPKFERTRRWDDRWTAHNQFIEHTINFSFDLPTLVHAIVWEVFAREEADLFDLLWSCTLDLERGNGDRYELGSVASYTSYPQVPHEQQNVLEELASIGDVSAVMARQQMFQCIKLDGGVFLRGMRDLHQEPLAMKAGETLRFHYRVEPPFRLRGDLRIRPMIHGIEERGYHNYR